MKSSYQSRGVVDGGGGGGGGLRVIVCSYANMAA